MIPFGKIPFGEEEKRAMAEVMDSGWVAPGPKTKEFEERFAEYVGAKHAVFLDSCTAALFLALQYLRHKGQAGPMTVPSLTFTATAEEVVHAGFDLRFGDVDDANYLLKDITPLSMPVHLFGVRAPEGALVYDSAHRIEPGDLKTSNALWCYSFYATKNISTVTGGMIATNDTEAYNWLCAARDHGLTADTASRYQGAYKQYDVAFVGWRFKGDDLRAAIGIEQLKKLPAINARRNDIVARYNKAFNQSRTGNYAYPILVRDQGEFINYMYERGVQCTVHFRPLHTMTGYKPYWGGELLPATEHIGSHIVSLPLYPQLTEEEITFVINTAKESGMLLS